eukprot:CCRYP_017981-RA/>CCRYP_017981-RA protein AED:0.54 eAED:1.00 QI:0/0/0/1/1/1/2/0/424
MGGNNSPVRYIPKQDPVQDALEENKKTTYFKLTLPNTGNELKVVVWASGTPEQFLLHVQSANHACKQMGLDTSFKEAEKAVKTAKTDVEIAKGEYVQLRNAKKKKKKGGKGDVPGTTTEAVPPTLAEAKALYYKALKALKALEAAKLAITMAGAKLSELYGNALSNKAHQPWEKIIKTQGTRAPWEDIKGVPHMETPTKTWDSFHECIMFHLLQVFRHDEVEQLNSYLETLLCLFYSPKANRATKKVLPLDDADLGTHLLRMCPAKWQTQYDLMENTTPVSTRALLLVLENIKNNAELEIKPASTTKAKGADQKRKMESMDSCIPKKPKKVGWTDKHCVLCKKHGGMHKSHNTCDCRRYNKYGTPIKKNGGAGKPHSHERKPEGANFAQIVPVELKKALRKKSGKRKKRRADDLESSSNSEVSS